MATNREVEFSATHSVSGARFLTPLFDATQVPLIEVSPFGGGYKIPLPSAGQTERGYAPRHHIADGGFREQ